MLTRSVGCPVGVLRTRRPKLNANLRLPCTLHRDTLAASDYHYNVFSPKLKRYSRTHHGQESDNNGFLRGGQRRSGFFRKKHEGPEKRLQIVAIEKMFCYHTVVEILRVCWTGLA